MGIKQLSDGRYLVDFQPFRGAKRFREIFDTKLLAKTRLTELQSGHDKGQELVSKRTGSLAFRVYGDVYYKEHCLKKMTNPQRSEKSRVDFLKGFFGDQPLRLLKRSRRQDEKVLTLDDLVSHLKERQLNPWTVNRYIGTLVLMLNKAAEWGYLTSNPIAKASKLPTASRERFFTREEYVKLIEASQSQRMRDFLWVGVNTGFRLANLKLLKESDIFPTGIRWTNFKNKKLPKKMLPMNPFLKRGLAELIARRKGEEFLLDTQDIEIEFRETVERAGIPNDPKNPASHVVITTMRHTFASWAIMKGVLTKTVAEWMGHATSRLVEETYGHLAPDFHESQIQLVGIEAPKSVDATVDAPCFSVDTTALLEAIKTV